MILLSLVGGIVLVSFFIYQLRAVYKIISDPKQKSTTDSSSIIMSASEFKQENTTDFIDIHVVEADIEQADEGINAAIAIEEKNSALLIESDTYFSVEAKKRKNWRVSEYRQYCVSKIMLLTDDNKNDLYNQLTRGTAILSTEEQLYCYMFSFGKMHQEKLLQSYEIVRSSQYLKKLLEHTQRIEIIDYGCGQGIATLLLLEELNKWHYLNHHGLIDKLILIEPSELALKRASLNTHIALKDLKQPEKIYTVKKLLNDILIQDLQTNPSAIKFHLFSNILDVWSVDIEKLAHKIKSSQEGINYFVCVSPNISAQQNQRLDDFMRFFLKMGEEFEILSERDSDIVAANKSYKRYEKIFLINLKK